MYYSSLSLAGVGGTLVAHQARCRFWLVYLRQVGGEHTHMGFHHFADFLGIAIALEDDSWIGLGPLSLCGTMASYRVLWRAAGGDESILCETCF